MTKFIEAEGVHYNAPTRIEGVEYLRKEEIIYRNDSLVEYILWRSEGGVSYSRGELEADTLLKSEFKIPMKREIEIDSEFLIDDKNRLKIDRVSGDSIIVKNNNFLFLYKILK